MDVAQPAAVTAGGAAAQPSAHYATPQPGGRKSPALLIALVVAVLLAAGAAYWWLTRPEPDFVAEDVGLYPVVAGKNSDGTSRMAYIDKSGNVQFQGNFDLAGIFVDGMGLVRQQGKFGFIDMKGQMVVPPQFDGAHPFYHGLAAVKLCCGATTTSNDQWGFIGHDGKYVINPQFQAVGDFISSVAPAKVDGKWGLIDKSGKMVVPATFSFIANFSESLAPAGDDRRYGFIGKDGKFVIPAQFEFESVFREGLAWVRSGGKTGYIDRSGKMVISPQFDSATNFRHGFAVVSMGGKSGIIDKDGKFLLNPGQLALTKDEIGDDELPAKNETGWGYIDHTGKWLIQPVAGIETAGRMYLGIALVRIGGESNWIDKDGNIIFGPLKGQPLAKAASAANETGALAAMRSLLTAEITYSVTYPQAGYADQLSKLGPPPDGAQPSSSAASLITGALAQGETAGYRFLLSQTGQGTPVAGFNITATPANGVGRIFCAGTSAVIRVVKAGETCDPENSPALQ